MTLRLLAIVFYPVLLIAFLSPIIALVAWPLRLTSKRLITIFAWMFVITQSFYIWVWTEMFK